MLIRVRSSFAPSNSWLQIGSVLPTSNPFTFTDSTAPQYPVSFYRLLAP
jgi:hypothetical protein